VRTKASSTRRTRSPTGAGPYEEGWSSPERPLAVEPEGTAAREQREGENLDRRPAEEHSGPTLEEPGTGDGPGDLAGGEGEPLDDEAPTDRAGRLGAPDEDA